MSDNDYPDPLYFPSQAWFSRYEETINDDEEYNEMSEGWGVGFDGDIVFEMTEMPVDDLDVDSMPEYLHDELDQYMNEIGTGYTGYAYLGLEDGRCTGSDLISGPDAVDAGFHLTAHNEDWEELLRGDTDIIQGLMSGKFELDGDMQKILQYSDSAQRLTSLAASIDATFARKKFS
ncbi:SCP2 sterol-binding domain-containing protein [Haladaptatus sp. NG-WS-4]